MPRDNPATPGRIAPVPRLPSGPSPAPSTTGVPAGRPTRGAAAVRERKVRRRRQDVGQLCATDPGDLDGLRVPCPVDDREQAAPARGGQLRDEPAREGEEDEVLEADPRPGRARELGLVLGEPPQLRQRRHGVDRRAAAAMELGSDGQGAQLACDVAGAGVGPRHEGRERPQRVVQTDESVHRRAHRQGEDRCAVERRHDLSDGPQGGLDDGRRVLDPPAGLRSDERVLVLGAPPTARTRASGPTEPAGATSRTSKATTLAAVVPMSSPMTTGAGGHGPARERRSASWSSTVAATVSERMPRWASTARTATPGSPWASGTTSAAAASVTGAP